MPSLAAAGHANTGLTDTNSGRFALIKDHELVDIFIGVDVGKSNHHAVAIDRQGKKILDRALPQDEAKLQAIIRSVAVKGRVLLVVDQPSTIGALPVAVAQAEGIMVGYLPG
ncbi:IS110 family transposase, partial [Pseudarthrobacter sp. MDT3-1]